MGDRAEVSHQLRTSDDHALRLGCWADGARLSDRLRASGVDRCGYSGGPAPEVRGRLFVPLAGPWLLGRGCAGRRRCGGPGGWCEGAHSWSGPTARAGVRRASGDILRVRGQSRAGGGVRRRRGRESCPRTRGLSPPGADRTRPRGMSPSASGMRLSVVAAEARDSRQSRRPPVGRRLGVRLDDVDTIPIKDPCDKPDLSLVHLTGVQGPGILCGNRSTSYGRRRIPDRSGRPAVAVHQSNRQGRSRAPSSGQVRDDVPRGDQRAPGR